MIKPDKNSVVNNKIEISLMRVGPVHPRLVPLISCHLSDFEMAIVMPRFDTCVYTMVGNTTDKKLPVAQARSITHDLLVAVVALHVNNLIHRDIKLENLLWRSKDGHASLGDYGCGQLVSEVRQGETICGTPAYQAPEANRRDNTGAIVPYNGFLSELWAVAMVVVAMLSGDRDLDQFRLRVVDTSRLRGLHRLVDKLIGDRDARDFIKRMLVIEPSERMSLLAAFEHPVSTIRSVLLALFYLWRALTQLAHLFFLPCSSLRKADSGCMVILNFRTGCKLSGRGRQSNSRKQKSRCSKVKIVASKKSSMPPS